MIPYDQLRVIDTPIPAERQSAKRHYGVHPYFTRRPYNVVRSYIQHFSKEGDRVLDPFGGSGVTAIEAFLEGRVGIHNDINPLANFIAQGIADLYKEDVSEFRVALHRPEARCKNTLKQICCADAASVTETQAKVRPPENIPLPRTADVKTYDDLFTTRQLI